MIENPKHSRPTLAQKWEEFAISFVPAGAGPEQRKQYEMCFYTGAMLLFRMVTTGGSEAEVGKALDALTEELKVYGCGLLEHALAIAKMNLGK